MEDQHQQEVGVEASRREESSEGNMVQIDMPSEDMNSSPVIMEPQPPFRRSISMAMGSNFMMGVVDMTMCAERTDTKDMNSSPATMKSKCKFPSESKTCRRMGAVGMEMLKDKNLFDKSEKWVEESSEIDMPSEDMNSSPGLPVVKMGAVDMELRKKTNFINESKKEGSSGIEASGLTLRVQPHGHYHDNLKFLKDAYLSINDYVSAQRNSCAPASKEKGLRENHSFKQETDRSLSSTVLHIAASYGNDDCVEAIVQQAPDLLKAQNSNGDTALHVAAKAGHLSTLKTLLAAHRRSLQCSYPEILHLSTLKRLLAAHLRSLQFSYSEIPFEALNDILVENDQGNTFLHEALLNGHEGVYSIFTDEHQFEVGFKELVEGGSLFRTNKEDKSVFYLAIEAGYKEFVGQALAKLNKFGPEFFTLLQNLGSPPGDILESPSSYESVDHVHVLQGKSPLLVAVLKKDRDILDIILTNKPEWIHLRDIEGRTPLHYAASIGHIEVVEYLLERCASCATERDTYGSSPLHLASDGGHDKVLKKLLEHCPDPMEILDTGGRNILHLAVKSGKFNVVRHILQDHELGKMINEKDDNGNTPLHLATLRCHPKIVHALTWEKRVDLTLINKENQTALDVCQKFPLENPNLRQRLTWVALKSAGVRSGRPLPSSIKVPPQSTESLWKQNAPSMDQYKDRINTLMLVSTLIVTVTFAAGFTLPGGTNSSDPGRQGMALMLNHTWFNVFILCITISMYGAIGVIIILIWAQLGEISLALLALKVARHLLGVTLATLSVAFLAGVHLVISDLSWLATTSMVMAIVFTFMLMLLYILLWFPSPSRVKVVRCISYYPFLWLASLVEHDKIDGT